MQIESITATDPIKEDLRWYFQAADAAMGLQSLFPAMVARIQRGGHRADGAPVLDLDERLVDAATRARRIRRALELMAREPCQILRAVFDGECAPIRPFGEVTGIAPLTIASKCAWVASNTNRPYFEWLFRLAYRCENKLGDTLEHDRRLIRRITGEAEETLAEALRAYARACAMNQTRGRSVLN